MHEAVFAHIEISSAGAAAPLVGGAADEVFLKQTIVGVRVEAALEALELVVHLALNEIERRKLARSIVDKADRGAESKAQRALRDEQRVGRVPDTSAVHRVHVHVERRVLGEPPQLLIEYLRLFCETSSGMTLSMLICRRSRPASLSAAMRALVSRYPFVSKPANIP